MHLFEHGSVLMTGGGRVCQMLLHLLFGKAVGGSLRGDGGLGVALGGKPINDLVDEGDGVCFVVTERVGGD